MAGNAAAIKAAQEGLNVLLVDRGKPIGSKNLSGGILWGHWLDKIIPNWWQEAPVERPITRKGFQILTRGSSFQVNFENEAWRHEPYNAFSILRARFDKWFSEKAAEAGAMVVEGVNVEHIARENGNVVGVDQGGEILRAKCVLIADGCNSRLCMDMGIRKQLEREHSLLGVKEIIKLPQETLEDRFNVDDEQGLAIEYLLAFDNNGAKSGAYLYTNKDTISLGVMIPLESIWRKGVYTHEIMEEFRLHPTIATLLKGGEMVEYGAHLVPDGGYDGLASHLYGNGYLVSGDAAGFLFSNGLVIQGMNYAIASGIMAAETVVQAKKKNDFSEKGLASYKTRLENSFVMQDMRNFQGINEFTWNPRMHDSYAHLIDRIFTAIYTEDGRPKKKMWNLVGREVISEFLEGNINPFEAIKDAITMVRRL